MDRAALSALAHADHPVAAPLADDSVAALLQGLRVPAGGSAVDLGCGGGQWLVRLLAARPDVTGTGVDTSAPALAAAAAAADDAGVSGQVTWVEGDAAALPGPPVDAALCVGSTHALGGLVPTLMALRERVRSGGTVLLGDGFWEVPPSPRAREVIGELPDLPTLLAACRDAGWEVVGGHVSTAGEWDGYEWSWSGALARWGLAHPGKDGEQALALAREHQEEWVGGYRAQLGFVVLVLQR